MKHDPATQPPTTRNLPRDHPSRSDSSSGKPEAAARPADGAPVQQWSCNGGANQDFRLR